jgi:protein TonB
MPSRYSLRRLAAVWAVTLVLHAAALFGAGWITVARQRPVELIRISLRPGGGGGGGRPAPQAPPPSTAPPAEAAPPVAPVVAPPVPSPAVVVPPVTKPHPAAVARPRARKHPQRAAPREEPPPAVPAPQVAAKPAPGVGAGAGSGLGTGTGAGVGSGSGTGAGSGSGSGSGEGAGTGSGPGADQRAFCVYCPEPGYPLLARRRGWRGSVDVSLVLLADGRVQSASVHRSSGYSILDEEAVAAARRSRFQLAQGVTAPVRGRIEYRFELRP